MNIKAGTVIRININNLTKPNKLYNNGMRPFVYSTNKMKAEGIGWHRGCENLNYNHNGNTVRFSKKNLDAHWLADGTVAVGKE